MIFLLGLVAGVSLSILVLVALLFFRVPIERATNIVEKQMRSVGPRPKGFIIEPLSESEESRQRIIAENRRKGRDTKLEELQ